MTNQLLKTRQLEKIENFVMGFGIHEGKTYKELYTNERQYIRHLCVFKDAAFNRKSIECFLKYMNIMSNLYEELDKIKEDNERQRSKFIDDDELVDSYDDELVDSDDDELVDSDDDELVDSDDDELVFTVNRSLPIDIIKKATAKF